MLMQRRKTRAPKLGSATMRCAVILTLTTANAFAQSWSQAAKLLAGNGAADDNFGGALAVDNGRAIVGAITAAGVSDHTGAAYIYDRDQSGAWNESARLFASDGQDYEWFGYSGAISGDLAVVGAPFASGNQSESGAAYVFRRDGSGAWSQEARLVAPDGVQDDRFGHSVGISDEYVIVGAPQAEGNDYQSGVVYVFYAIQNHQWSYLQRLVAADGAAYDLFGTSIGFQGALAIGASQSSDQGYASGAVYIFGREGTGYFAQQQKLLPTHGQESDLFGTSVASHGSFVIVGAPNDDENGPNAGAAYVFESTFPGPWIQAAKLLASDGSGNDQFGISVSIESHRSIIGAYWDGDHGSNSGSAYIFEGDEHGAWAQQAKLTADDGATGDWFGQAVGISGTTALVGSPNDDDHGDKSGSAYFYYREITGPALSTDGICPGAIRLHMADATPLGAVAFVAGFHDGPYTIPTGPCHGLVIEIKPPLLPASPTFRHADANGRIQMRVWVQIPGCGVFVQAIDATTCTASNRVQLH